MTRNVLVAAVVAAIMAGSVLVYTYLTPPVVSPMAGSPEGQRMTPQPQATPPVAAQLRQIQRELMALRKELAVLKPMAPRGRGQQPGQMRPPMMPMMGPCGQLTSPRLLTTGAGAKQG